MQFLAKYFCPSPHRVRVENITFCTDLDIQCNSQPKKIVEIDLKPTHQNAGGSINDFSVHISKCHAILNKKCLILETPSPPYPMGWGWKQDFFPDLNMQCNSQQNYLWK